jgi:biotin carboxylase
MKKHILIIEGFPPPHDWLLENNYRLSWLTPVERLNEKSGHYRKVGMPKNSSIDEWVELAKVINKVDPIEQVVNFREQRQLETAAIGDALNLKWHSKHTVESVIDKYKMRVKLKNEDINSIKFRLVENEGTLNEVIEEWGFPFVLKPVDGSGSNSIFIINNNFQAREAWNKMMVLGIKDIIAEELLIGREISMEAFSQAGDHQLICITEKYKDPVTCIENGHCVPAVIDEKLKEEAFLYLQRVLNALGIKEGMTHTEIFLTSDGPFLVETHLRMGGGFIPELVKESLDIDMLKIWLEYLTTGKIFTMPTKEVSEYAAIWFKHCDADGEITNIDHIGEATKMNNIITVASLKKVGESVTVTSNSMTRLGYAIAKGTSPEEAISNAQKAIESVNYRIKKKDE